MQSGHQEHRGYRFPQMSDVPKSGLSLNKQLEFLSISKGCFYYKLAEVDAETQEVMRFSYFHPFDDGMKLREGIRWYMSYYNDRRFHQGICHETQKKCAFVLR